MDLDSNIHYLLGQLSMADEMIEDAARIYRKYKAAGGKKRLIELKAARQEVVDKLKKLADTSVIYTPKQKDES